MSKAEKFISDCTRNCSNYTGVIDKKTCEGYYVPWIAPEQARKAVEIAKEEVIEKTLDFLKDKLYESGYIGIMDLCDEYIKAMKYKSTRSSKGIIPRRAASRLSL